jgi:hypothetical protein
MGGDRGGGKKWRERGGKGVKNHPRPSLVSSGGPGWGVQKAPQGRSESVLLLPCAWAASLLAATPTGSTGTGLSLLWAQFATALFMGAVFTVQPSWTVAGGGRLASRYVGGEKDPRSLFKSVIRQACLVLWVIQGKCAHRAPPTGKSHKASEEVGNAKNPTHPHSHPPLPSLGWG